ncbi:MAG: hypothetical protein ABSC90_11575 [Acidimicrobiales bacterium]
MSEPAWLNVDFNYGGGNAATNQGAVMLYPKSGNRQRECWLTSRASLSRLG